MAEQIVGQLTGSYQGTSVTVNVGDQGNLYNNADGALLGTYSYPGTGDIYNLDFGDEGTATWNIDDGMIYGNGWSFKLNYAISDTPTPAPTSAPTTTPAPVADPSVYGGGVSTPAPTTPAPTTPAPAVGNAASTIVGTVTIDGAVFSITDKDRVLNSDGVDIGYVAEDVNGGYNVYTPQGGYHCNISPQGVITDNTGTVSDTTASITMDEPLDNLASVTVTDASGNPYTYYLNSQGQFTNADGAVLGTYTTSADGRSYELFDLNNESFGTLDSATGNLTFTDGSSMAAGFTPIQYTPPMHGDSTITSDQTGTSTGTTAGTTAGTSAGTSTSTTDQQQTQGIDWSSPVASALQEGTISSAQALPGLARQAGEQAQDKYKNLIYGIGLPTFQGDLNTLAGRNVLSSSVAGSALANAMVQANQNVGQQAFDASLASTQAQMQVPGQMSDIIASLGGQVSDTTGTTTGSTTGTTTGTTAGTTTGTTTGGQTTTSSDPLSAYYLMNQMSS